MTPPAYYPTPSEIRRAVEAAQKRECRTCRTVVPDAEHRAICELAGLQPFMEAGLHECVPAVCGNSVRPNAGRIGSSPSTTSGGAHPGHRSDCEWFKGDYPPAVSRLRGERHGSRPVCRYRRERDRQRRATRTPNLRTRYSARWQKVRLAALARDHHRCVRCGAGGRLEVDHITPLNRGGQAYDLANLVSLCSLCHHREEITA